jgi:hypothetical protein
MRPNVGLKLQVLALGSDEKWQRNTRSNVTMSTPKRLIISGDSGTTSWKTTRSTPASCAAISCSFFAPPSLTYSLITPRYKRCHSAQPALSWSPMRHAHHRRKYPLTSVHVRLLTRRHGTRFEDMPVSRTHPGFCCNLQK